MKLKNKDECTGCGLCSNVCPAECIKMEGDSEGFYYPFVNQKICVVCGRCEKYCYNTVTNPPKEVHVYAAYNKDLIRRLKASSGGIFELLSREVLSRQGVVFGVKMDGLEAIHTYVETLEDLDLLLGSKYMQSDVGRSYQQVKEFLQEGRWVLFSGTPCQVDALLKFLGEKPECLLTVDFICHGISSPKVFEKYIDENVELNGNPTQICFRDKTEGWNDFSMAMITEKGQYYRKNMHEDVYLQSFLKNMNLRRSCFNCVFRTVARVSDLTLGDFWGCENIWKDWMENKGYSLIFVQNEKGKKFWNSIQNGIISREVDLEKVLAYNQSMLISPWDKYSRDLFFKMIRKETIADSIKKVEKNDMFKKIKRKWWKICRKND